MRGAILFFLALGGQRSPGQEMFVDEVDIFVIAGDGGNGCVAFRREKHVPHGGPSGGNGGDGGSIYIVGDEALNTLHHLTGRHHWRAERGGHGEGSDCHGRKGEDLYIRVPAGTIVSDTDTKLALKDLSSAEDSVCVAVGGRGGRGNASFKSSTNQAPRHAEPGQQGQQRRLHLELKLIADAGIIGKPNAGKSTLLSRLSDARPKVAAYPFTTLTPCLGIVELRGSRRLVMADIPGLIEGAHAGTGLGDEFLRHIERTRLLVHMVDICPPTGEPAKDYLAVRAELEQYSAALGKKREVVVANKMDLTGSLDNLHRLRDTIGSEVIAISAVTGEGLDRLMEKIWAALQEDR